MPDSITETVLEQSDHEIALSNMDKIDKLLAGEPLDENPAAAEPAA